MKKFTFLIYPLLLIGVFLVVASSCEKNDDNPNNNGNTFTDTRDGTVYQTVTIGNQTWMAENLNYKTDNSWWYDNSEVTGDAYGRLYTWEAALNACPDGWHLPSDDEWKTLEMALGMSQSEADNFSLRGTDQGEQMKSTMWWSDDDGQDGNGTNSSGFNGLPGGYRSDGSFYDLGYHSSWWTSTSEDSYAIVRYLAHHHKKVERRGDSKTLGCSVRCVRD